MNNGDIKIVSSYKNGTTINFYGDKEIITLKMKDSNVNAIIEVLDNKRYIIENNIEEIKKTGKLKTKHGIFDVKIKNKIIY